MEFVEDGDLVAFDPDRRREGAPFRVQGNWSGKAFHLISFRDMDPDQAAGDSAALVDEVVLALGALKGGPHRIGIGGDEEAGVSGSGILARVEGIIDLHPGAVARTVIVPEIVLHPGQGDGLRLDGQAGGQPGAPGFGLPVADEQPVFRLVQPISHSSRLSVSA